MSLSLLAILLLSVPDVRGIQPVDISSPDTDAAGTYVSARPRAYAQVRIEKRVIIRVPRQRPSSLAPRADFSQEIPQQTYKEKKIGKCLPMDNILGVQMFADQYLDLLTRDRKRIAARGELSVAQFLFRFLHGKVGRWKNMCGEGYPALAHRGQMRN